MKKTATDETRDPEPGTRNPGSDSRRGGFSLLEVLAALAIFGMVAATLLAANARNVARSVRSRETARVALLLEERLADAVLFPPPLREEETDWTPFSDAQGQPADADYVWKRSVREVAFTPPDATEPLPGRALWEVKITVAPAANVDSPDAVSALTYLEPPPTGQ